jgi:hypothetical protein
MYAYEIGNELIWFYTHCAIAIVIVIADARGTLEPTINKWEKKLGIPVPEVQDDKRD